MLILRVQPIQPERDIDILDPPLHNDLALKTNILIFNYCRLGQQALLISLHPSAVIGLSSRTNSSLHRVIDYKLGHRLALRCLHPSLSIILVSLFLYLYSNLSLLREANQPPPDANSQFHKFCYLLCNALFTKVQLFQIWPSETFYQEALLSIDRVRKSPSELFA